MQVAVLSDIHDHIWNLDKALGQIKGNAEQMIFCGDFCAPFISKKLAGFDGDIHACLGNNDEDQVNILKLGGERMNITGLAQEFGTVELDGKKIAFCHYPKLAELLAKTGEYDAVFHGHTHVFRIENFGRSLLVNPGAICGIQKGKEGVASFGIYDTSSNAAEIVEF